MDVRELFSRNLKRIRTKQNISQLVLANRSGLTHTFINEIENCRKWISPDTIACFCNTLKVDPFQFFLSDGDMEENDKKVFSVYVEDLSSTIINSVNEFKTQYLNQQEDEDN